MPCSSLSDKTLRGGSVQIAIDMGPFDKFVTVDHLTKSVFIEKIIVLTLDLSGTRLARGIGNRVPETRHVRGDLFAQGRLPAA